MGDAVAPLSEDAITRLGVDAYLLDGSRAHAERLLRAAALHVASHTGAGPLEARVRAAMADRYVHHARLHRALHHHRPAAGVVANLAALTPRERAVMVLRHVDGLSTAEIAAALGVPERAIAAALRRGGAALGGPEPAPGEFTTEDATEDALIAVRRIRNPRTGAS